MERQRTIETDQEREHLRRLRNELFTQPPLEFLDDPKIRRKIVDFIDRAARGREWPRTH